MNKVRDGRGAQPPASTGNWASPIALDMASELPPFPTEALRPVGQGMVKMVSEVNQVDCGLAGSIYMGVLSACLAKKTRVDLRTHTEPLNLYICPVLPSGERKSSTVSQFVEPIVAYQHSGEMQGILIVDDVTPERLGSLMSVNGERMAILSAEGGIFDIITGRYAKKESNLDLFLKAHAGDAWSSHRISRIAEFMVEPALTICVTVQPEVIKVAGGNQHLRGRGMLARFLYAHCEPQAGKRFRTNKVMSEEVVNAYRTHVMSLLLMPSGDDYLRFSPDAQRIWNDFYDEVETELKAGGKLHLLRDWGSKLAGAVARIAGLLHLASEHGGDIISTGIARDAVVLGRYFMEHAIVAFDSMKDNPSIETARTILEFIRRWDIKEFKPREIIRHTGLDTMAEINPGLKVLLERNYITERQPERSGKGGRPEGITYMVNPHIYVRIEPKSEPSNGLTADEILAMLNS